MYLKIDDVNPLDPKYFYIVHCAGLSISYVSVVFFFWRFLTLTIVGSCHS